MRVPTVDDRPRRRFGIRGWMIGGLVAIVVLLASLRGLAGFYTDYLWFDEVGQTDTWRGLLAAKVVPALVFMGFFFVLMFVNLVIADRIAPRQRPMGPEDEMIERYRQATARFTGRIRIAVSAFFALVAGAGVSAHWKEWLLFRNRVDFNIEDPQFHRDIGFYVFQLPFVRFALEWTFVSLIVVLIVVAVWHYVNGGIRVQSPWQRVTPQVKAHLSVILALMSLVKTAQYYFDRFELNFSSRGTIDGASYTDVHAQLPALNLLMIISVFAAALFIANIWRRGWVLPIIAVGLWGLISLIVGTIYPQYIQRFQVRPNEFAREEQYIERNIEATRAAFKLDGDNVETRPFEYTEADARDYADTVDANMDTLGQTRVWDPAQILQGYKQQQKFQSYYDFNDVDVDRYSIDGELTPSMISVRQLNPSSLPNRTWTNSHLVYTHGYGAVLASATDVASNQSPNFLVSDIPLKGDIDVEEPGIYYGEGLGGFSIVNSKQAEQRPSSNREGEADESYSYSGSGGVETSSMLRRAALAIRFWDVNPLISNQITDQSRAMYYRDVRERAEKAAPFLAYDSDPYPVVLNGRVKWVLDGYTTTTRYPYSQRLNPQGVPGSSGLATDFNYVRNSVKVVVDAYDGTMNFYVIDDKDPMIVAWGKAFPDLFDDKRDLPPGLEEHFRFPADLFQAQTEQFTIYHITDPLEFFKKDDIWDVAPQATTSSSSALPAGTPTTRSGSDGGRNDTLGATLSPSEPLYLTMKLPGDKSPDQQFVMMRPFVPRSTNNQLSAFMVGKSDPGVYGKLVVYTTSRGTPAPSPTSIHNQIESDQKISSEFTLLGQQGSSVIRGEIQLIPIGSSIIYVRPIYVQGTRIDSFPLFKFLVVSYGKRSVLAADIEDGINQIFKGADPKVVLGQDPGGGSDPPDDPGGPTTTTTTLPPGGGPDTDEERLACARDALAEAETARLEGDLGTYQEKVAEALNCLASTPAASTTTPPPVSTTVPRTTTTTLPEV